jgi:hypothetical protein
MTKQHRVTPEQWESIELYADDNLYDACLLELRARIEALEAGQQPLVNYAPVKPEYRDKLDRLIEQYRSNSQHFTLVDRVATDAELCQVYNDAPEHSFGPALRAVYDLGRQHGAVPIRSGPESPLVERVADAIAAQATSAGIVNDRPARAAILEVAKWMRTQDDLLLCYGLDWATRVEQEAN